MGADVACGCSATKEASAVDEAHPQAALGSICEVRPGLGRSVRLGKHRLHAPVRGGHVDDRMLGWRVYRGGDSELDPQPPMGLAAAGAAARAADSRLYRGV